MALTFKEVSEIMKIIDASDCEEVILELEGLRLVVRRGTAAGAPAGSDVDTAPPERVSRSSPDREAVAPPARAERAEFGAQIRAPMVGSFYRRPSPDQPPFVELGSQVQPGDPLCLIEVMKLYTTIEAIVEGTVRQIAAEDGQLVEFDQLLFVISPD
ncbi:MAG: acetyl-CoA carboxylase biotin carboxyl carrier protein [Hyphomicrobiaceae bacterium]